MSDDFWRGFYLGWSLLGWIVILARMAGIGE
jgi:hypothetical protein